MSFGASSGAWSDGGMNVTPRLSMPHTHYMALSGSALRTAIGITSGLCFLAFGYGQGDIGGLMTMKAFRDEFPMIDAVSTATLDVVNLAGITVASWNLGCFVGAVSHCYTEPFP